MDRATPTLWMDLGDNGGCRSAYWVGSDLYVKGNSSVQLSTEEALALRDYLNSVFDGRKLASPPAWMPGALNEILGGMRSDGEVEV